MTTYVDIGPVRIQQYLARTPRLRDTAGASARLAAVTSGEGLGPLLGDRAEINTEAGDADGVVNLIVHRPGDVDAVIDDVLAKLRDALPGAWFQAVSTEAADYVQAVALMRQARADGRVRDDLPAAWEFPFAAPCRLCRTDPAVTRVRLGDDDVRDACADCLARQSAGTRTEGTRARRELAAMAGKSVPSTFEELAALGRKRQGRNHLATVYADGNAVGDLFARLADLNLPAGGHGLVSKRLSAATRDALESATMQIADDDDAFLCVLPHVVGGDDLLASLPADRVWPFVRTFLGELCRLLAALAADHGLSSAPTVSAGIVIAHDTYPFHMVADAAYDGLKRAKRHVAGQEASIHLHDVTAGGSGEPMRLADLERIAVHLDALAALPQSGRSALGDALRRGGADRAGAVARRLDRGSAIDAFLAQGTPLSLEDALRMTRWWR
ncbi:Cas10/Cmr2 second palm domain-containing protein [Actinomadura livida]|uniref:Cas10/Cmr2 second palm domain-containing protein n=1 Tax=Actinomadura livida TaxID=79909 RepID=A0A7W7I7G3_9ACTN|nr:MULTISPECIES: hypothetical protein [Actinomadura]MBB4771855.1 hypothetical protein [Actinomadura catellatispora]GGU02894.1 hypothetical protein GCM10010208_28780 [Actinomadura livida]